MKYDSTCPLVWALGSRGRRIRSSGHHWLCNLPWYLCYFSIAVLEHHNQTTYSRKGACVAYNSRGLIPCRSRGREMWQQAGMTTTSESSLSNDNQEAESMNWERLVGFETPRPTPCGTLPPARRPHLQSLPKWYKELDSNYSNAWGYGRHPHHCFWLHHNRVVNSREERPWCAQSCSAPGWSTGCSAALPTNTFSDAGIFEFVRTRAEIYFPACGKKKLTSIDLSAPQVLLLKVFASSVSTQEWVLNISYWTGFYRLAAFDQ